MLICINCKTELDFKKNPPRGMVDTICPICKTKQTVDYDFVVLDDGGEWDLHTLIPLIDGERFSVEVEVDE